jgi:hypothetical protein
MATTILEFTPLGFHPAIEKQPLRLDRISMPGSRSGAARFLSHRLSMGILHPTAIVVKFHQNPLVAAQSQAGLRTQRIRMPPALS